MGSIGARLGLDLSNHLAPDLRELELPSNLASKRKQIYFNEIQTRKPWAVPIHGKLLMTAFHEPNFSEGLVLGAVCGILRRDVQTASARSTRSTFHMLYFDPGHIDSNI